MQSQIDKNREYCKELRIRIGLAAETSRSLMKASYKHPHNSPQRDRLIESACEQDGRVIAYRAALQLFIEMNKGGF